MGRNPRNQVIRREFRIRNRLTNRMYCRTFPFSEGQGVGKMAFRGNMTPSLPTPNPSQEGNLPSDRKRDSPPGRGYREYFQGPSHFSPVYGPTALLAMIAAFRDLRVCPTRLLDSTMSMPKRSVYIFKKSCTRVTSPVMPRLKFPLHLDKNRIVISEKY